MKLWLTRTQPGADRQAAELRCAGYRVQVVPLLEIVPLVAAPPPGPFDIAIFVSEHAVRIGLPQLEPGGVRVFAVGEHTARTLADAGVVAAVPPLSSSEGLLAMPELQDVAGARVLLVSGADGRELLADQLTARGAQLVRYRCYQRRPLDVLDPQLLDVDAIVAWSGAAVTALAPRWFAAGGRADVPVLVPSARVAALGVELGFHRLHDCRGASSAALLDALNALQATGTR